MLQLLVWCRSHSGWIGDDPDSKVLGSSYKSLTKKLMRQQVISDGQRFDRCGFDEPRSPSSPCRWTSRSPARLPILGKMLLEVIEGLNRRVSEGEMFRGTVIRVIQIGDFVAILPGKDGMIHISQLSESRVAKVDDVVHVGDQVTVRVRQMDNHGRINLSLRDVPQQEPEVPAGAVLAA